MRTIVAMILREMTTVYGRSPGGYIWAILQPVGAIALLSFVFSQWFRAPSLGTNFPLFYATGYLPFMFYMETSAKVAAAIRYSRPLLTFGAVTWMDLIIARWLLSCLTHLIVFVIVIAALSIFFPMPGVPNFPVLLSSMAMAAALGAGVGMLNCFLFMTLSLWEHVWSVITRPLFIVSGIFFVLEDVPSNLAAILWFNPIFHITGEMRNGIYPTYDAVYVSPLFVYGVSLALFLLGLSLFSRSQDRILDT